MSLGWENVQEEMTQVAKAKRPTLGDGLSDELKLAIEKLRQQKR